MINSSEYGADYAQQQIARRESIVRRFIKRFYIERVLIFVEGPTIDIGCGAGQLLQRLPEGSIGVEENRILLSYLRSKGLNAIYRERNQADPLSLPAEDGVAYRTVILSHVLEHIANAEVHFRNLLKECWERGILNVIVVVPGVKGYASDQTHRTFISMEFMKDHNLLSCEGFGIRYAAYFPGNISFLGKLFVYHELMLVYRRDTSAPSLEKRLSPED